MTRTTIVAVSLVAILAARAATAQDYSNVKSGMLLGIYTSAAQGGMQVSGLIPGYSAEGRLQPGDVLLRVAVDENTMFRLRSLYELEDAKIAIGPNREAAVELWRPQVGLMYAWVEFTPIYGPASPAAASPASAAAALVAPARSAPSPAVITSRGGVRSGGQTHAAPAANAVKSFAAQFKLESEKPGARAMFQKQPAAGQPVGGGNRSGGRTPVAGNPGRATQPGNLSGNRSGTSAIDLFKEAKKLIDR